MIYEYQVTRVYTRQEYLGVVQAKHQPDALRKARETFPAVLDTPELQASFAVRRTGRSISVKTLIVTT